MVDLAYPLLWIALAAHLVHLARGVRWTARMAAAGTIVAWASLTGGLAARGLEAGHWPLANRYEFALSFTWSIVTVYSLFEVTWREKTLSEGLKAGTFVIIVALVVATYALSRPSGEQIPGPLQPALRSVWLQVHVLSSALGYGACGVAAGFGLAHFSPRKPAGPSNHGTQPHGPTETERAMRRCVALAFPWLTLGILSGAIWAQRAWGRYWGWDPKETWALVTWLWYLLILHLRPLRRWRGRRLAVLLVAGFCMVGFTFVGVPWLVRTIRLESLHGF